MSGALFNILIPTEHHEIHLSQNITCDCSNLHVDCKKQSNDNIINNKRNTNFHLWINMKKTLEAILSSFQISNSVWNLSHDNRCHSVTFSIASNEYCEHILDLFMENGIGMKFNSVVVILPCSLYYQDPESAQSVFETNQNVNSSPNMFESSWKKFLQSVRTRLTIAQVVQGIEAGAMLTFDFLILLVISVTVASLGLMQGQTLIFVSSMLLSPLIGPVNAATFGTMVQDKKLRNMGIVNEIIGLILCVIIGFGYGLITLYFDNRDSSQWVTTEMAYMSDIDNLWVGIILAFLIGIAVPIALLGNNTFSLVGVAISTSLLPPAVNAIKAVSPKKHNCFTSKLINEYLNSLKEINSKLPKENTNYLTQRLKDEYASALASNTLNIRGSYLTSGYNPFDLAFVTWSPGFKRQYNQKSYSNTQTDVKSPKLLEKYMKSTDLQKNESRALLKEMFESPKENNFTVGSNTSHSSAKRFIITPATLKGASNNI
ncbi:Protein of unknown function DUF389 [Cinara cedri]|uniref:DUF389 domain-containing protein n=1 Tax=Cinara cedri TaxID=506608 RepID=A0A5E4N8A4_9HEMI|nr:Protein of unknown function DUF389 [Cinara cedri]